MGGKTSVVRIIKGHSYNVGKPITWEENNLGKNKAETNRSEHFQNMNKAITLLLYTLKTY